MKEEYKGQVIVDGSFVMLFTAICIKLFNFGFSHIAKALVNWENHEFYETYEEALTIRLCIFYFINSYSLLIYYAFIKEYYGGACYRGNCMLEL